MPRSGSKKSGFLNIPARLIIKENDNATGSYPTILRMGDKDRIGNYKTQFDDTNTITFGRRIRDNFELLDKDKVDGILGYTKNIDTSAWVQSGDLEIRKELFTKEAGSTAQDGALVLAGAGDSEGRWLRTKKKIKNPTIEADIIFGPYNESRTVLGYGLGLKSPGADEATGFKIQVSITGLSGTWITIKTLTGNVDTLFTESSFTSLPAFTALLQKRKRTKIKLTPADFSIVGNSEFYLRFAQTSVTDSNQAEWAIGYVNIDYYNENVNYPLMIDVTSRIGQKVASGAIASPHSTPTIVAPGRSISGISDVHIKFTPGEGVSAFDDARINIRPEDYFFQQGSDPDIIPGMSSPLWSKTQIVFDLSPNEETTFGMTTPASTVNPSSETDDTIKQQLMVYWNNDLRRWEKIAQGVSGNAMGNSLENMIASGALGFSSIDVVSTGSDSSYANQVVYPTNVLSSYVRPTSVFGFPFEGKYHATASQYVKASDLGITKPFVLEKCQISFDSKFEFPFDQSAPGGDASERAYGLLYSYNNSGSPSYRAVEATHRAWIPTFFILRQQDYDNFSTSVEYDYDYRQYLTESSRTIQSPSYANLSIKNEDLTYIESSREMITYGQITLFTSSSAEAHNFSIRDVLDKGISRDAEVDILQANGQGSGQLNNNATINPLTGSFVINFPCRVTGKVKGGVTARIQNSNNNSIGLRLDNRLGGRAYGNLDSSARGLTSGTPTLSSEGIFKITSAEAGFLPIDVEVQNAQSFDNYSPYIIMPEDNLVLGWQYPMTSMIRQRAPGSSCTRFNSMTLYGKSKLTLFGSQLQDSIEFHETVNQNLGSDSAHEMIGSEPVIDQFELSRAIENFGNYLDNFVAATTEEPTTRVGALVQSRLTTPKGQGGASRGSVTIGDPTEALSDPGGVDDGDLLILQDHLGNYGFFFFFEDSPYAPQGGSWGTTGGVTVYDWDDDGGGGSASSWIGNYQDITGNVIDYNQLAGVGGSINWWSVFDSIDTSINNYLHTQDPSAGWDGTDVGNGLNTVYALPVNSFSINIYSNASTSTRAKYTLDRLRSAIIASSLDIVPDSTTFVFVGPPSFADIYNWYARLYLTQGAGGTTGDRTIYLKSGFSIDSGLDNYHGINRSNFSGGNNLLDSTLGSFVRVSPTEDSIRIYSDSLLSNGDIGYSNSSFGTMQTGGNPIRPKYYLDTRKYGQLIHFLDQAKDSKTTQNIKTRRSGLLNSLKGGALQAPVTIRFVSGSVSDTTGVQKYTAITADSSSSVNKTINSVLTGAFYEG